MIKIQRKSVQLDFDGDIIDIPVNNLSTSTALKLSDFMQVRKKLVEEIQHSNLKQIDENSSEEEIEKASEDSALKNRALNQLMEDLYSICIFDIDNYRKYINQIPIEMTEAFIQELMMAMRGETDKKKQTLTESESSKSKTGSGSAKRDSAKTK